LKPGVELFRSLGSLPPLQAQGFLKKKKKNLPPNFFLFLIWPTNFFFLQFSPQAPRFSQKIKKKKKFTTNFYFYFFLILSPLLETIYWKIGERS
jgi:hypothetical protein